MSRNNAILVLGLGAAAVAGAVLISQSGRSTSKTLAPAPKPDEVLEPLAKLKKMREQIYANRDNITVADWMKIKDPLVRLMDETYLYLLTVMHHIAADAESDTRGENGHVLTDQEARQRAMQTLGALVPVDDVLDTVSTSVADFVPMSGVGNDFATWIAINGASMFFDIARLNIKGELLYQMRPLFNKYLATRKTIGAMYDAMENMPPSSSPTKIRVPKRIPDPDRIKFKYVSESPLSILFAEGGRSSSYGYFWDFEILAGQAAELLRASSQSPDELIDMFRQSTLELATFFADRTVAVLSSAITGDPVAPYDQSKPKGPSGTDVGTVLVVGGVIGIATLGLLSLGGRRGSSPSNTPTPIIIST